MDLTLTMTKNVDLENSSNLVSKCFHSAMRSPYHVESGVRFDRYLAGLQGSVVGGPARCEGLFLRGKMRRRGSCSRLKPSLVCLFSCLYSTNLNHNIQGGYCQIRYIVLTVWWAAGSGYPIHQWNVRENNMGRSSTYQRIIGLGTHQQKLYREWSRQQIICSKFRTISNDQSK